MSHDRNYLADALSSGINAYVSAGGFQNMANRKKQAQSTDLMAQLMPYFMNAPGGGAPGGGPGGASGGGMQSPNAMNGPAGQFYSAPIANPAVNPVGAVTPGQAQTPQFNQRALMDLMRVNPELGIQLFNMYQTKQGQITTENATRLADIAREQQAIISTALDIKDPTKQDAYILEAMSNMVERGQDPARLKQILDTPDWDQRQFLYQQVLTANMKTEDFAKGFIKPTQDELADNLREDRKVDQADLDRGIAQQNADTSAGILKVRQGELGLSWAQLEQAKDQKVKELEKQDFTDETGLRKEFTAITKDYALMNDAYGRVQAASDGAPTGPSDMSMIFAYMKMLDPASTVREGEYASAQNTTGIPGVVLNAYNKAKDGTILNKDQRRDFKDQAKKLFEKSKVQHKKREKEFTRLAVDNQLNPKNVVFDRNTAPPDNEAGVITIGRFQVKVK